MVYEKIEGIVFLTFDSLTIFYYAMLNEAVLDFGL